MLRDVLGNVIFVLLVEAPVATVVVVQLTRRGDRMYNEGYWDGWDTCDQNWKAGGIQRPSPLNVPDYDTVGRNPNIFPSPPSSRRDAS